MIHNKPPLRIDCQSHLFPPELLDYMERRRRVLAKHCDVGAGESVLVRSGG